MAGDSNSKTIGLEEKSLSSLATGDRLAKWLFFSLILHSAFLLALTLSPYFPSGGTRPAPPIYTVDLVGGEKIGGNRPGSELYPSPVPKDSPKKVASESATPVPEVKQTAPKSKEKSEKTLNIEKASKPEKNEKPERAEKIVKPTEKAAPGEEKLAVKSSIKKEEAKNEPTKEAKTSTAAPEESSLNKVRERLIQSAVDRVKSRAESAQQTAVASKAENVLSVGPGEGDGATALGQGGRGGGTAVKGAEFLMYQTKIVSTIKENWAWPGQKASLKALVRFSIKDNGEITGMKIAEPSGDSAFDESILRALRKSSPLPAPPESYRKDFSQVEMNFQP
jgi:TonB family protein